MPFCRQYIYNIYTYTIPGLLVYLQTSLLIDIYSMYCRCAGVFTDNTYVVCIYLLQVLLVYLLFLCMFAVLAVKLFAGRLEACYLPGTETHLP